jgi:hypothetical protein
MRNYRLAIPPHFPIYCIISLFVVFAEALKAHILHVIMNSPSSSTAPPAYEQRNTLPNFLIGSANYRSIFTMDRPPNVQDYRDHLECMKDLFGKFSQNVGSPSSPMGVPHILDVQYSQAFCEVAQLICEYHACLLKIKPMQEQDIIYLLLHRFAQSTGAGVYLEIRTPKEVQIYDSEIPEPQVSQMSSLPLSSANEREVYGHDARAYNTWNWRA